jgi:two-component system response regulator AtoC
MTDAEARPMTDNVLLIEDEPLLGAELKEAFTELGWDTTLATTLVAAERLLFSRGMEPLVVVSDMNLPDGSALDLLEKVRARGAPGEWIFLTAYGSVPDSVRALKLGAYDFLEKPTEPERLALVLAGAARSARAQRRLRDEAQNRGSRYTPEAFVGHSPAARQTRDMLERLARVPLSTLVITGETGTGKGLAARILHHAGPRGAGPLVEVNCAALPRDLMEAELFGHEAGAFTGAKGRRRGLIEQASGGTLFLDEIGELEPDLQAKLLKAIEDRRIRRLGSEQEVAVDLQVIAATNQDLQARVRAGGFRADLYHRLSVFRLEVPELRSRKEDIADLVPLFIDEFNALAGKQVKTIPGPVWSRLGTYDWPGNVRELRNVVERCVLLADGAVFPEQWLYLGDAAIAGSSAPAAPAEAVGDRLCLPLDGAMTLDEMEQRILGEVLSKNGDNVSLSARVLGTTREKLRYRVQKYGLKTSD